MDESAKTITIGGKEFVIPLLPLKVRKRLWPISIRIRAMDRTNPSESDFEDMVSVVYAGVSYGNPEVTRDVLEDLPVTLDELQAAIMIISVQASGEAKAGANTVGEPTAGTNPSTGTN